MVNEVQIIVRAACFGCPVVSAKPVHDSTARPGLAAERLEGITEPDGSAVRLAVEDRAQVINPYQAPTYGVSVGPDNNAARVWAARVVAACAMSLAGLPRRLTGNGEVHAKDMSLVATLKGRGRWTEVPCTPASGDH